MRVLRFWGLVPAFCLLALPPWAEGANELKLGATSAKVGSQFNVPLTLTTTDEVQGLVAAFEWEAAGGVGVGLVPGAALAEADVVVTRVEATYMVIGVVMDSDGQGTPEIIPPGADILIATAQIRCSQLEQANAVSFADMEYATVDGGPLLENIVVVGGLSIGAGEGLVLTNGSFECGPTPNRFHIDPAAGNRAGSARVLMDNRDPVEGYVVALCQDPSKLTLTGIALGQAALDQAADFQAADVLAGGGTLGVVIDLVAPFTNNTIPAGEGHHIATYSYRCAATPQADTALVFCNNVLGDPLKENVMVIGGLSVDPILDNGTFKCESLVQREICDDGIDNTGNGLVDCDDPQCFSDPVCQLPAEQSFICGSRTLTPTGLPGQISGSVGGTAEVCFYILNPEDHAEGQIPQFDHIQGFSMALTFCCDIAADDTLDISGTILEAIGAEYVNVGVDNDPDDGDGCEMIIGVLVDALPPFDGATIPPIDTVQRMGCVTFTVKDDAAVCGLNCPISFTDGVNGPGKVPIRNLIAVENVSRSPLSMIDCSVQIVGEERFFRGDCNFSGDSSQDGTYAVDIADAAAVVSFLFAPPLYKPVIPCLDACDCNDDGRIDLADAVCILQYLFQNGRFPPAPGPGLRETSLPNPDNVEGTPAGPDLTPDLLDCAGGTT